MVDTNVRSISYDSPTNLLCTLVYQPQPYQTLRNAGVVRVNKVLSDAAIAGTLFASTTLFGPSVDDHLQLFVTTSGATLQYRADDYPEYIVHRSPKVYTWPHGWSPAQYARRLAALDHRVPAPLKDDYFLRLQSKLSPPSTTLVQFNDLDFVTQARATVDNFGLDPDKYMDHLEKLA